MKKIFRAVAALVVVMFAGCTNDLTNDVVAPVEGGTTVTVGLDTKTYLGELEDGVRKVYWSNDDQIVINGQTSTSTTLNEEKTVATFVFAENLTTPYSALYPAEMYKDPQTITLPAVQSAATGSFGADSAPMAAYTNDEEPFVLHHLAAVVRLRLKAAVDGDTDKITKVEFLGKAGEQVSGDFTIDYTNQTLTAASVAAEDKVVAAKVNKTLSTEAETDVFVVVPAQAYAEGFTVRVYDELGHYMEKSSGAITLARGEIKAMPAFEFVPTKTSFDVEIKNAADLVAFAQAYNAGEYDDATPIVHITADLNLEGVEGLQPIGCKTAEGDRYFEGFVDGNGHSIKNWVSGAPLFGFTASNSSICNLTIDASCTLTTTAATAIGASATAEYGSYFGAFVGYHKGLLKNCHNNANVTAEGGNWPNKVSIGGLVGRLVNGSIEGCSLVGDFLVADSFKTVGEEGNFGGIAGNNSNAEGVLLDCYVYGNVSHKGGSSYVNSNSNDGIVHFGGIVGVLYGTCTNCHLDNATANTKRVFFGNYMNANYGDAEEYNDNDYRTMFVGGIVGLVEEGAKVENCTNDAELMLCQYNGEVSGTSTDVSRYLHAGGIVGFVDGTVNGCTMYGDIANRSSCLQQFIGGVIGNLQATGTASNCANDGKKVAAATAGIGYYQARNNNLGGIIGATHSTNLSSLTNRADVVCSRMNSKTSATLSMGGIIGKIEATSGEIDGKDTLVNYGTIYSNHDQYNNQYTAIGGVIGEARCSVKGVVNEGSAYYIINSDGAVYKHIWVGGAVGYANGELTLTSVENKGAAYINISKAINQQHFNLCVGGVLGTNADAKTVALVNCANSGSVAVLGGGTRTDGRSLAVGGVVGALIKGTSSISGCTNTGAIYVAPSNNTHTTWLIRTAGGANYVGGIAGYVEGTAGTEATDEVEATAADLLSVTNCTNNRNIGANDGVAQPNYAIQAVRGAIAGLVGGAKFAEIKSCNCTTKAYNTNSTSTAGLVSAISNSVLEECTISNSILNPKGGVNLSGAVAYSVASTIKNNILNNVEIKAGSSGVTNKAVLAGTSDSASVFTDNKVSGTLEGAAITLDSKMIGSGTPTVTGTTLYTE